MLTTIASLGELQAYLETETHTACLEVARAHREHTTDRELRARAAPAVRRHHPDIPPGTP